MVAREIKVSWTEPQISGLAGATTEIILVKWLSELWFVIFGFQTLKVSRVLLL